MAAMLPALMPESGVLALAAGVRLPTNSGAAGSSTSSSAMPDAAEIDDDHKDDGDKSKCFPMDE